VGTVSSLVEMIVRKDVLEKKISRADFSELYKKSTPAKTQVMRYVELVSRLTGSNFLCFAYAYFSVPLRFLPVTSIWD
jgi:large-conductance mechanosensitive channel